ncbi:MAG: 4Fe-4S binding protein [Promethearchaeota archaeon]
MIENIIFNIQYFGVDKTRCTECQQCVDQCPTQAITFDDGMFTFDPNCTACFRCYNFCPTLAITIAGRSANPKRHRQHQTYIKGDYY